MKKMIRDQFDDFHIKHDDLYIQFCVQCCNLLREINREINVAINGNQ